MSDQRHDVRLTIFIIIGVVVFIFSSLWHVTSQRQQNAIDLQEMEKKIDNLEKNRELKALSKELESMQKKLERLEEESTHRITR